jgi:phosphate transport system substrate-binding protein
MSMFRSPRLLIASAMTATLAFAFTSVAGAAPSGGDLSGEVNVSGSSTVEPITALVAELFAEENSDVAVRVDGPGTSDGFELFCSGETDISDASRPIDEEEIATCQQNGIEYVELYIAIDGLSVITSTDNDEVKCLSFADLYALTGPESEGVDNWSDASALAQELGGKGDFPDADLDISAPGEESGTYGSFIEIALADPAEARVEAGAITEEQAEQTRPDYQSSGNDNTIIEGVAGSETSLGWVGFAFARENSDRVKSLKIENEDGKCIAPKPKTIASGRYPIARPLFIYVNTAAAAENPAVGGFVDFYLTDDGITAVEEAGYIPVPDADFEETTTAWEDASS